MSFIDRIWEHVHGEERGALLHEMHAARQVPVPNRRLAMWISAARSVLRSRGVEAGQRVVLLAPNSARWVAADLAIMAEGAIAVPMYARQEPSELVEMMRDCGAKVVISADAALTSGLREHGLDAPVIELDELLCAEGEVAPGEAPVPRQSDDVVTIIYTSGTSGVPKGVMLTVGNVDFMLPVTRDALIRLMGTRGGDDRVFHYLPFCFAGSRVVLWTCLFRGNPIWMSTNLEELKDELAAARPHYFLNVPALLERIKNGVESQLRAQGRAVWSLYEAGRRAYLRQACGQACKRDGLVLALARSVVFHKIRRGIGADLECLICGSAPLAEETQRWFEMLGIPVYQVYGLTETTAIVTMDEPRAERPGRVGHAIAGCEVKLDAEGELLVKGPNVFAGYWGREDATAEAFEEGWFKTGDAAEVDSWGNWRIVGRTRNILVPSSGHNVAPEPLEQGLLERLHGAEHVVVFGHGRPYLTAVVSGAVDSDEVRARIEALNRELPHYRRIRRWHLTRESFTPENGLLTANQKLRRRALESRFRSDLDRMYA